MKLEDKLVWVIQFDEMAEVKKVYDKLICLPSKHRNQEITRLIDTLYNWLENSDYKEE